MPTIAIVGAGPGLGTSLARRFGREGYRIAMLARGASRLSSSAEALRADGIDAHPYPADVLRPHSLHDALTRAAAELGGIDVLEFSPTPAQAEYTGPLAAVDAVDLTIEAVTPHIEFYLHGGITAVQAVLPGMIERGSGAIVVTTGASSGPVVYPPLGNIAAASGALRNWTVNLHAALRPRGIYAAHVAIATYIGQRGPESQPDAIADAYWNLLQERSGAELVYGEETGVIA